MIDDKEEADIRLALAGLTQSVKGLAQELARLERMTRNTPVWEAQWPCPNCGWLVLGHTDRCFNCGFDRAEGRVAPL